ncbi:MAG: hypothetical protein R6W66_06605 [Pelovirga sp.]
MNSTTYRIRKNFLIPMGLTVLLGGILLFSSLFAAIPSGRLALLAVFLLPAVLILAESSRRRVHIHDDHIVVDKILRSKRINFSDLTSVEAVKVRKRVFISLSTADSFLIISNSYAGFDRLVRQLVSLVPPAVLSEDARLMAEDPPLKCSDTFSAWLAVAVLTLVIIAQFRSIF